MEEESFQNRTLAIFCTKRVKECLLGMGLVLLTILLGLISIEIVHSSLNTTDTNSMEEQIINSGDLFGIEPILDNIEAKTDPCNNFHLFVCNRNVTPTIDNPLMINMIKLLTEPIQPRDHNSVKVQKNLFQTCLNEEKISDDLFPTLEVILKELGGWPVVTNGEWSSINFDWLEITCKIRELGYDYSIFLELKPLINQQGEATLQVSIPHIAEIYNTEDGEFMAAVAKAFGAKGDSVLQEMNEVFDFTNALIQHKRSNMELRDEKYSIADYQKQVRAIDWLKFINTIGNLKGQISSYETVLFTPADVMSDWLTLILNTPKRTLANYMLWRVIEQTFPFARQALNHHGLINASEYLNEIAKEQTGICSDMMFHEFRPNPVFIKYMEEYFPKEKMEEVTELLENMKLAVMDVITDMKWINAEEIKNIFKTLKNITLVVGKPENAFNYSLFDNMEVDMGQFKRRNFFYVHAQTKKHYFDWVYSMVRKYRITNFNVETVFFELRYSRDENVISIPPFLLQYPEKPQYMKYASMGFILHQLLIDGLNAGQYHSFFSSESLTHLEDIGHCMANNTADSNKKNDLLVFTFTQKVLNVVYEKYVRDKKGTKMETTNYTPKQLFWISFYHYFCTIFGININVIDFNKEIATDFHCYKTMTEDQCSMF